MKYRIFVVSALLFFTNAAYSAIATTPPAVPSKLHVFNSLGDTYVDHVVDGCGSKRYYLSPDHKKYDAIVSILLSAQVSKKDVQLIYDGCRNNNNQGIIVGVYLL